MASSVYQVLYTFAPEEDGELAVVAGDSVYKFTNANGIPDPEGWMLVQKQSGQTGFIPSSYAEFVRHLDPVTENESDYFDNQSVNKEISEHNFSVPLETLLRPSSSAPVMTSSRSSTPTSTISISQVMNNLNTNRNKTQFVPASRSTTLASVRQKSRTRKNVQLNVAAGGGDDAAANFSSSGFRGNVESDSVSSSAGFEINVRHQLLPTKNYENLTTGPMVVSAHQSIGGNVAAPTANGSLRDQQSVKTLFNAKSSSGRDGFVVADVLTPSSLSLTTPHGQDSVAAAQLYTRRPHAGSSVKVPVLSASAERGGADEVIKQVDAMFEQLCAHQSEYAANIVAGLEVIANGSKSNINSFNALQKSLSSLNEAVDSEKQKLKRMIECTRNAEVRSKNRFISVAAATTGSSPVPSSSHLGTSFNNDGEKLQLNDFDEQH